MGFMRLPPAWRGAVKVLSALSMGLVLGCRTGVPIEEPLTRAIITDVAGWNNAELDGALDDPLFPVAVPGVPVEQDYGGRIIANNPASGRPYPTSNGELKFFDFDGPDFPELPFNNWIDYTATQSRSWTTDPADPLRDKAVFAGNYIVGLGSTSARKDQLWAHTTIWFPSGGYAAQALGTATLPWKFNYEASSIVGSATAVDQGADVWVQATADLPAPVSYSWAVDGVGKSWTGSFVTTSFSQQGWTAVWATMTGANGAHVTRQWNFLVTSGCPNGEIFC